MKVRSVLFSAALLIASASHASVDAIHASVTQALATASTDPYAVSVTIHDAASINNQIQMIGTGELTENTPFAQNGQMVRAAEINRSGVYCFFASQTGAQVSSGQTVSMLAMNSEEGDFVAVAMNGTLVLGCSMIESHGSLSLEQAQAALGTMTTITRN